LVYPDQAQPNSAAPTQADPGLGGHGSLRLNQMPAIVFNQTIPAERRLKFRFPLDLTLRFRPLSGSLFLGAGRAANLSSGGILVVSEQAVSQHEIGVGARVEISIEWPSLLDGKIPLQLFAVGRVVRSRAFDFAAAFEEHQFRTLRSSSRAQARLRSGVIQWPD
jgi:hypothetical protein